VFLFVPAIAGLIVTTGAAQASSFVVMGESAPVATPSIVALGAPAPASAATPSIVAMGEPLPTVTGEKVAAIPHTRKWGPRFQPLVIRGGLADNAFAVASPSPQQAASGTDAPPEPPAPDQPPAYLPPNGLGKHRW